MKQPIWQQQRYCIRKGKGTGGGDLPTGRPGVNVYVLRVEPKEHKCFRLGARPGGSVTGVTEKLFYVPLLAPTEK